MLGKIAVNGKVFERHVWTGGDTPPANFRNPHFIALRRFFFREDLKLCGGLDLWKCAGTSSMERARIFWNAANLNAWRTLTRSGLI